MKVTFANNELVQGISACRATRRENLVRDAAFQVGLIGGNHIPKLVDGAVQLEVPPHARQQQIAQFEGALLARFTPLG